MAMTVRLRMAVEPPSGPRRLLVDKGADGSFQLEARQDIDAGPQDLFKVTPETPRGSYTLSCQLNDPFTGERLAADDSSFVVQ